MLDGRIEIDQSPSVASRQVIPACFTRYGLTIFPPSVGRVTLSNDPVVGDGQGLVLTAGQSPVSYNEDDHGATVHRAWYALYSAGATGIGFIQNIA